MKWIFTIVSTALLFSCSTTYTFNEDLANENMSKVKEIEYYSPHDIMDTFPIIEYMGTKLLSINGDKVIDEIKNHAISEGKNNLYVMCKISVFTNYRIYNQYNEHYVGQDQLGYESKTISGKSILNKKLIKGHTYNLEPFFVKGSKKSNDSCFVEINDATKI